MTPPSSSTEKRHLMPRRLSALVAAVTACLVSLIGASPAGAATHALISGSGSSWAANAINQWISDVNNRGLQVVYTSNGSATGRRDFGQQTTDYGVSDIGYQGKDPQTGQYDLPCSDPTQKSTCRPYAYLPIVAGGTAFPYQIREGGQLVRNLRLSGETLAKIFTGQITNWDDPEITKDNNGRKLPSLQIVPVVHSEGSGSSAQFSTYLATDYPSIWHGGAEEYFQKPSDGVAEDGSDGVINFVTSSAANGAIGYDEYSYALGKNYPVAKVENKAGYFTAPTQYNVAVALTKAQINYDKSSPDYLLQKLDRVYVNPAVQTYPVSSYSYMIIPTGSAPAEKKMTTPKRQTLADFLYYSICQGQAEMGPIGYSPLPINLVQAGFTQIGQLHNADKNVNLTNENVRTCHNPTFVAGHPSENYLAKVAPKPPACDKVGAGPCVAGADEATGNPNSNGKPPPTSSAPSGPTTPGDGGTRTGGGPGPAGLGRGGGGGGGSGGNVPTVSGAGHDGTGAVDPITGQRTGTAPVVADGTTGAVIGSPTTLAASSNAGSGGALAALAGLLLLLVIALPPVLANRARRRRGEI